ncbi:hypothetical protein [Streptomyces sp. NPDC004296]|uniref:hypothetical protein n=1 Tax=Streptomyces sp. NPDC004296 TaxID=3364697 RepID=UPI0036AE5AC9
MTGSAFLLLSPGYSWYALLLIALDALDGRGEWLAVAVAGTATYVTARAFPAHGAVGARRGAAPPVRRRWRIRRSASGGR